MYDDIEFKAKRENIKQFIYYKLTINNVKKCSGTIYLLQITLNRLNIPLTLIN